GAVGVEVGTGGGDGRRPLRAGAAGRQREQQGGKQGGEGSHRREISSGGRDSNPRSAGSPARPCRRPAGMAGGPGRRSWPAGMEKGPAGDGPRPVSWV